MVEGHGDFFVARLEGGGVFVGDDVDEEAEAFLVCIFAGDGEDDAEEAPAACHAPFLPDEGGAGVRDGVEGDHEAGHEDGEGADDLVVADLEGAREVGFFFPQDEEGEGDHAVGEAAAEVAGIDDPDEHLAAGERRDDGEEADEVEGVDGRLVFRMELREEARHHVGFRHGVEGAAAAH